jgi:hypothetical protein
VVQCLLRSHPVGLDRINCNIVDKSYVTRGLEYCVSYGSMACYITVIRKIVMLCWLLKENPLGTVVVDVTDALCYGRGHLSPS